MWRSIIRMMSPDAVSASVTRSNQASTALISLQLPISAKAATSATSWKRRYAIWPMALCMLNGCKLTKSPYKEISPGSILRGDSLYMHFTRPLDISIYILTVHGIHQHFLNLKMLPFLTLQYQPTRKADNTTHHHCCTYN